MTSEKPLKSQDNLEGGLSKDDLFHILSNSRRRDALHYLNEHDGQITMRDMAEWIAAREHNTSVSQLRSTERQPVYIALYQCHLPQLDDYGIIEYNQARGTIRRTNLADRLNPYLYLEQSNHTDGEMKERVVTFTKQLLSSPSVA
ncbi:hypothetical protein HAPAU_36170 [Halalkalicoccus paucihalophilus]|uniref:DUF7344 domain-containing protein n=1 Tax=Halalkalicoccus paucihalophilus TaxID=1008153 RepID=A0A151AAK9_9EURY|nr:hypothetical protein HAPAU_36170 [Halalkalicoccus paucihalophilus]